MIDTEFMGKVRALPARQQVVLWSILKNFQQKGGTRFTAAELAEVAAKLLRADSDEELARMTGGVLSSLVRNGMIEKFTGGRQPIWQLVPELHKNAKEYKEAIFPVTTYWEKE